MIKIDFRKNIFKDKMTIYISDKYANDWTK